MTNAQTGTLVLEDSAGNYFLVPQETLEQGRVAEEHKAQVEQLMTEQQDAQGYLWHALLTPIAVITVGAVLIGRELNKPVADTRAPAFPHEEPEIRVGFVRV